MRRELTVAMLSAAAWLGIGTANANIVQDGGFENATIVLCVAAPGSFGDGWNVTTGCDAVVSAYFGVGVPYDGMQFAYLDVYYNLNTLSQTLATIVGQTYTVSFYVADTHPNFLEVTFGGIVLFEDTAPTNGVSSANDYVLKTFNVTATSASTVLSFSGQ